MGDPLRNGTVNSQPSGHLALGTGHMLHARVSLPYPQLLCRLVYKEILAWKSSLSKDRG